MPAVISGKVLVTGANGFLAYWLVKRLLEQGYSVRGTVRAQSKGIHLLETFKDYTGQLEIVEVEDIAKPGAFDQVVKGVDAIFHSASPVHLNADDPDEQILPAVGGTKGLLQSAMDYGNSVKRFIYMSSCATVFRFQAEPATFNEDDWNDTSVKEVQEKGRDASGASKYCASKTLAERAAWAFMQDNKDKVGFDLVAIQAPYVFGPFLQDVAVPEKLNSSNLDWWDAVVKGKKDDKFLATMGMEWIDVRDVALAHILSLQKEAAGGNRCIVSSGVFKWQDFVNIAHTGDSKLPAGNTSYDPSKAVHHVRFDVSKARKDLGIKYITLEEGTKDMLAQFKEKGWIA
ncbi:hypothetical protein PHLCEN_2v177 [Hermanssonia centrifuga]|uniref:NAD-dependent epimerase/dehydratase domain-containing protein n=1 Tax=Hermanssonia centrifuga TaxID=98765 RepID=A0A2R6S6S5_9APHY|nr:hypothetical protein PHLCEN_2v177 [Hermanssonia centrifuga]